MEGKRQFKVGDFVRIKKAQFDELDEIINNLDELRKEYMELDDASSLDRIKREISGYLIRYAFLLSYFKAYKDGNHTYLGEARKKLKAEVIDSLIRNKVMSFTNAKEMVYNVDDYKNGYEVIESIKRKLIMYEDVFDSYNILLQAVIQSISILGKSVIFNQD